MPHPVCPDDFAYPHGDGGSLVQKLRAQGRELLRGAGPVLRPAALAEASGWTLLGWAGHLGAVIILARGLAVPASESAVVAAAALGALTTWFP